VKWKKGWIENRVRSPGSVSSLVDYRVLSPSEASSLLNHPHYSRAGSIAPEVAALVARSIGAEPKELRDGSLLVGSQDPFRADQVMEVLIDIPERHRVLRFLAKTAVIHFDEEMKEMVFNGGIQLLAVNRKDLEDYNRSLERDGSSSGG